jgi:outer membrane protein OmpA-like peptidoglycan-associated protein
MSDAQPPESVELPAETPAITATSTRQPWLVPAFAVIALLVILITLNLRKGGGEGAGLQDLAGLKAEANALREQLNRERVALGLRPLEGNVESMQDVATRLSKDAETMVALAGSFQNMLVEKDAEISAKNSELIRSEQLRQSLANESARLQGELQRALVDTSEIDLLRRESAQLKQQRDMLAEELAGLRQQLTLNVGAVSAEIHADLERRLEETTRARDFFEARVAELESELAQSKLFASNENELLPAAVELFRSLRGLEGKPDSEISAAYSSLGVELGASVLHTLKFKTGSSELSPDDQETIRRMVDEIPDGDLLLAIGYASETGNVNVNRELSSDRATAAASYFVSLKRPGQLAQAVYLGQTDRFSSRIPERNQIVELWRIRRK